MCPKGVFIVRLLLLLLLLLLFYFIEEIEMNHVAGGAGRCSSTPTISKFEYETM
jgi:hypothetical protein